MTTPSIAYLVVVAVPPAGSPLSAPASAALPHVGQAFKVTPTTHVIGRAIANSPVSVSLPWMFVSRRHAQIEYTEPDLWEIEDLQSRNGTAVNGQRLQPLARTRLHDGDRIGIGAGANNLELLFCFQLDPSAHVERPQQPEGEPPSPGGDTRFLSPGHEE
jgi:hypothetical protein